MSASLTLPGHGDPAAGLGRALIFALIVEGLLLLALAVEMARTAAAPPSAPPIQITLTAPPAPKPATPPKPVVKPMPRPLPKRAEVHRQAPPRPAPKIAAPRPLPVPLPPSPVAAPTPPQPPVPPQAVTPAPPPPALDPQVKDSYLGRVKAAIQAAVRYPEAARMMGTQGRVEVAFTLRDGAVGQVRILVPGVMAAFTAAALAAVRAAAIPAPPAALAGKRMGLTLWVDFKLDGDY